MLYLHFYRFSAYVLQLVYFKSYALSVSIEASQLLCGAPLKGNVYIHLFAATLILLWNFPCIRYELYRRAPRLTFWLSFFKQVSIIFFRVCLPIPLYVCWRLEKYLTYWHSSASKVFLIISAGYYVSRCPTTFLKLHRTYKAVKSMCNL